MLGNAHRYARLQTVLRQQRQHAMATQVIVADALRGVQRLGHVELIGGMHRDIALVVVSQRLSGGTAQRLLRRFLGLGEDDCGVRIIVDARIAGHVADAVDQRLLLLDGHAQLTIIDEACPLVEVLVEQGDGGRISGQRL